MHGVVDDGVFLVRVRARWVRKMKKSMRCPEMKMYATTRVCTQFSELLEVINGSMKSAVIILSEDGLEVYDSVKYKKSERDS